MAVENAKEATANVTGLDKLVNVFSSGLILQHGRDWLRNTRVWRRLRRLPMVAAWRTQGPGEVPISEMSVRGNDVQETCKIIEASHLFDTTYYLACYPEVATAGTNPIVDFVEHALAKQRNPNPLFDTTFYLQLYPEVAAAGLNPLIHYINWGAAEGRKTSIWFDTIRYLELYPELLFLDINPLAHCLAAFGNQNAVVTMTEDGLIVEPEPQPQPASVPQPLVLPEATAPAVSIVVPMGAVLESVLDCLASLAGHAACRPFEVIAVIEAGSAAVPQLRNIAGLILVEAEEAGFAAACNRGAEIARSDYLVFLSPRTRVTPGWLNALTGSIAGLTDAGLVGSLLVRGDGHIASAGGLLYRDGMCQWLGEGGNPDQPRFSHAQQVNYCPAGAIIPTSLFRQIRGIDPRCRDDEAAAIDLGCRVKTAGFRLYCQPQARLDDLSPARLECPGSLGSRRSPPVEPALRRVAPILIESARTVLTSLPDSRHRAPDLRHLPGIRQIVVVGQCLPEPSAGTETSRLLTLMRLFLEFGYHVTFGTVRPLTERSAAVRALEALGVRVIRWPYNRSTAEFIRRTALSIDIVLIYGQTVAQELLAEITPAIPPAHRILYADGLSFETEDQEAASLLAANLIRSHNLTLVSNPFEFSRLRAETPERVISLVPPALIPVLPECDCAERSKIGLAGDFSRWQDVEAAVSFVLTIWPLVRCQLPDATLCILAAAALPAAVRALAATDIETVAGGACCPDQWASCRLVIAPVRSWRGFSDEVAFAIAKGVPPVLSPLAARGLGVDASDGSRAVFADPADAAAFTGAIVRLYHDEALWNRLSAAGLAHAGRHWTLEQTRHHLIQALLLARFTPAYGLSDRLVRLARTAGGGAGRRTLPDVLIFPVIDWHFRFQRPQHLALGMARRGHRVFYLKTDFTPADVERPYLLWEQPEPNVFIVQLNVFEPFLSICKTAPSSQHVARLLESLKALRQDCAINALISFVDLPFWRRVARALPGNLMVYDCMDYHPGFEDNHADMLDEEHQLIADADLVITTSVGLSEIIGKSRDNVLIRNACEVDHFSSPGGEVRRLSERPVVGYFGAIAHWHDIALVVKAARAYPDWHFVLIGSTQGCDTAAAEAQPNIEFLHEIPYAQLPPYLYGFDVCIIPFQITDLILYTNPVKLYEYLVAGKPVVATAMPEVMAIEPGLAHVGVDHDAFIAKLAVAMAERDDVELRQRRIAWARQQNWGERVAMLDRTLETFYPRVSVIVLTYNNLALTKACLASIEANSHYPNLELIVVDNASSDGSPDYLADYGRRHPEAKIILSDRNTGFSAGNNIGLRVATGDYLVLLNNDTQVTEGWVIDLLRHLRRDPTIGLVGPVTNNIGNEAKLDISYSNPEEMRRLAYDYCNVRRRMSFELRTVAFFCVMFSRSVFEEIGELDEIFGVGMFEDDDYCNRVRAAGYRIIVAEDVFIHHELSASLSQLGQERRQKLFDDNKRLYEAKWGPWIAHQYRHPPPSL